ncbi:MAG: cobalamin B12-binding domain-containing protein [Verrucomicrobia bacterium]|nr:cobalamin B12-binding domain-containing protein [Verrucomicrobiota bacterium]
MLLTGVFGPYATDDEFGSRAIKPMELYHSQVTRTQEAFSVRMFHRSWGLMLIHANIHAPCTLLDFPTLDRFIEEIRTKTYDVIGISAIMPNVTKVQKMCELIRQHQPKAAIVIGGHVSNIRQLEQRIDADYIVKGEGVRWMRRFLGEDVDAPIRHPRIISGIGGRTMGVPLSEKPGDVAATLIPSVGCPMGCNFCATSAMFGGKGNFVHFYETGDALFKVMCELEDAMKVRSFFVMDENFLLHKKRALRLLDLMIEHNKSWSLYIFSSANTLRTYTMEQIVGLGISWVWMGLEGKNSKYDKLKGSNTHALISTLQSHGVRVLGSTIIGLEEHTPANIDEAIDYAVSHDTEFHQFMLYSASPGTPLHEQLRADGSLLQHPEYLDADLHGQFKFNYKHPHIKDGQETEYLLRAFNRDFEVNGPSALRMARTILQGWRRYKNHPDNRIRERFRWEARDLAVTYAAALWAPRKWFRSNPRVSARASRVLKDICGEFGLKARLVAALGGRYAYFMLCREDRRLRNGWTYEPPTFYEKNEAAEAVSAAAG